MITYVNTVFVNNDSKGVITTMPAAPADATTPSTDAGKFVVIKTADDMGEKVRIGLVTDKVQVIHKKSGNAFAPVIRWTNDIKPKCIKSLNSTTYEDDTEDKYDIDFAGIDPEVEKELGLGGRRIVVRLQFKDLPTRYRKWSETYEYVTKEGDTKTTIAEGIANTINYQYKRARVNASATAGKLTIEAMPYDDDNIVDSISWAAKVRFTCNVYYTNPKDAAFASNNKYFLKGVTIKKTPGKWYTASAKLVRDREAQSFGYMGILNRGDGTDPIIQPDLQTKLDGKYDSVTLEFENTYRTADDWIKTNKQSVEIYVNSGKGADVLKAMQTAFGITVSAEA